MERHSSQAGYELVMDVRRLIIGFALLIVICGVFFILGFVEGKRQAVQTSLVQSGTPAATVLPEPPRAASTAPSQAPAPPKAVPRTEPDQLDWYDKVQEEATDQTSRRQAPAEAASRNRTEEAPRPAEPAPKPRAVGSKPVPKVIYSCQVGAFRQQKEAMGASASLKSRGYDPFIEAPQAGKGLLLLKVGRFDTRTEAAAMQLRLRKDGFSAFVTTNR